MKKFLVVCFSIIILVTIGFMMVFFISSNELYKLADSSWENKSIIINSEHNIQITLDNAESNTSAQDFELDIANKDVIELLNEDGVPSFEDGSQRNQKIITFKIKAISAGETTLTIHFNSKNATQPTCALAIKVADGSIAHPFVINNYTELSHIGRDQSIFGLNNHYLLSNNIVAEGNWTPIPGEFTGSLNGNGFSISHINLNNIASENSANVGLFETIGTNGKVYNLNLTELQAKGNYSKIGALAGTNKGTCYKINVSNAIIENGFNGGITGGIFAENSSTDNNNVGVLTLSTFQGKITTSTEGMVGGLVGSNLGSTVGYSYVKENTEFSTPATSKVGGLVGLNSYKNSASLVADCYSLAKITSSTDGSTFIGGTIGSHEFAVDKVNITYGCYYLSGKGFNQSIGSHADFNGDALNATTQSLEKGIYVAKGYDLNNLKNKDNFKSYKDYQDNAHNWDFSNIWSMVNAEQTPEIISLTYKIPSASSLKAPNSIQKFEDFFDPNIINNFDNFVITHDIDCGGIVIADKIYNADGTVLSDNPIYLDKKIIRTGKENNEQVKIFNFSIISSKECSGFFSIIDETNLDGLTFMPNKFITNDNSTKIETVNGPNTVSTYNFGILAGAVVASTLNNIHIDLTHTEFNGESKLDNAFANKTLNIGAIAGQLSSSTLNNCIVNGKEEQSKISTQSIMDKFNRTIKFGGIAGISYQSEIKNSIVKNIYLHDIDSYGGSLGGIAGEILNTVSGSTIINCKTQNTKLESLTNTNLENNGSNKDGHYTGGIVGYITIDAYKENTQTIVSCISNSTIKGHYVGGIVGKTYGNITRSTSNSICTGWKVGGIAGFQANKSRITNCLINGKLIQNNELRNSYKISKSNTVEDSGISNNAQIAGISALAIGLSNYNDVPHMENCFVNCEMEGDNQFKDSAVNKRVSGSKLIGIINNDSYKNYTWTGTIKNCAFNTHLAPNAKNRFEFSDDSFLGLGDLVFSLTYSYSIIDFNGTNWNAFDSFDKFNIWNIDSINNIVTIK